ncbi:MAG: hypothetical protein PHI73_03920 [Patescibacteria group bacterium]|nr:hypothetical protein [Patescibacteria group bacterium]
MKIRIYFGVFLTGASILMLEVVLTRILSVIVLYHFAFLVVSLALLSLGASGIVLHLFPRFFPREKIFTRLSQSALIYSLSITVFIVLVSLGDLENPYLVLGLCLIPFFFGGLVLSLALSSFSEHISRLYFADLLGSGVGCLAVIGLMNILPAPSVVFIISVLSAGAAWFFRSSEPIPASRCGRLALGLAIGSLALALLNTATPIITVDYARALMEPEVNQHVEYEKWNAFSRIVVYNRENQNLKKILIDSAATTTMVRFSGRLEEMVMVKDLVFTLPYHVKTYPDVLVLGPGGGSDIIAALAFGSTNITGIEINPIIVNDLVKKQYRDFTGDLYRYPGVHVKIGEARSVLERDVQKYDLIQNTFVDTWAATSAGAYALSENNLYTVEAFKTYFNHLTPQGVFSITRWWTDQPHESLRLISLALEAYDQLGIANPADNIIIVGQRDTDGPGQHKATFLFKKSNFTPEEIEKAAKFANDHQYPILYTPAQKIDPTLTGLIESRDRRQFQRTYAVDISPTTDNRPYFFYMMRFRDFFRAAVNDTPFSEIYSSPRNLMKALIVIVVFLLVIILLPAGLMRSRRTAFQASAWTVGYFVILGIAFMTVEIYLMQKFVLFLGHPVYALGAVLFMLLISSGFGSALTQHVSERSQIRRLRWCLLGIVLILGLYAAALPSLFASLIAASQIWRLAFTLAVIAPVGLLMGTAFPLGLKLFTKNQPGLVPWLWGINVAASVLGSVVAFLVSIHAGFGQTLLLGTGCYLLALLMARKPKFSFVC